MCSWNKVHFIKYIMLQYRDRDKTDVISDRISFRVMPCCIVSVAPISLFPVHKGCKYKKGNQIA